MALKDFAQICHEVRDWNVRIAPQTWDEPFINSEFTEYLKIAKSYGIPMTIDTNGLLLTPNLMDQLIVLKVDSIFISLDAISSETYKKVRGKDKLAELVEKVHTFLKLRGEHLFPRIGVSFVEEEENSSEKEQFVNYWKDYVDVIRVNQLFRSGRTLKKSPSANRKACWSLYDSMMIHYNGDAALCCVDTNYENKIGNVFKEGVLNVWNGQFFSNARKYHESGDYGKIKICETCDLWSNEASKVEETSDHIFARTETHEYVNRKDRLGNIIKENRYL